MQFENPFFSIEGQKERFSNVGSVLKASFGSGTVSADIKQPLIKSAVEYVANNPYTSMALLGGGGSIATAAIKKATTTTFGTIATIGAGSAAIGYVATNPNSVAPLIEHAPSIEKAFSIGQQAGELMKPNTNLTTTEKVTTFVKNNPVLTAAAGAAGLYGAVKLAPSVSTAISNLSTRSQIKKQTELLQDITDQETLLSSYADKVATYNAPLLAAGSNQIIETPTDFSSSEDPATNAIVATPSPKDVAPKSKATRSYKKTQPIKINNRNINIVQMSKVLKNGYN